jgi:hypothetical protein
LEREHEPAPSPPVALPAAAGGAAGPLLGGALTPARVLALQRTAGNRAVSALLMRDDAAAKTPVAGPGDLGVSGGVPAGVGNTTAMPSTGDRVTAKAPKVTLDGEAWVKDGKELGGSAYFGVVQNLVHSDRGAVYRHGGDPAGEIVAADHEGTSNKWDSVSDPVAEAKGEMKPQTFAPFYWQPGSIDDTNSQTTPAKPTRLGTPFDQPEFSRPVNRGPGRLTAFTGQDVFKMGLAVKKDAAVWMLTGNQWTVSWDVPVDASLNGAGKAVDTQPIQDLLNDGPNPALKDWSLAPGSGSAFEGFSTPAEAMKRTPAQLLNWIFAAREHDPTSYRNICTALDAMNPNLAVTVACATTDVTFGKDVLSASVLRNGALVKSVANINLDNGESETVNLAWSDAIGSAGALTPGTAISVVLSVGEKRLEATATIPLPFSGSRDLAPGSGKYAVKLAF